MADPIRESKISSRPAWAEAISDLRLHLKLSQTGLGARIGFSAMTISRWERGALEPPSHGYIGLGNLSRDATYWFFWERAGLRSEDVLRVLPILKRVTQTSPQHDFEIVTAGSGPQRVEEKLQLVAIPLLKVAVAGYGERSDNLPLLTEAPVENMIAAPRNWCPNPSFTSCLRVCGNSMAPLIQDGFVVAVDSSDTDGSKLHGKIVIAWHKDRGLTISRFRRYDHTEVLQPENTEYEAVTLSARHSWKIVARVLWWIGRAP
jgi:SOS-response transcriptional repressor LexA/transcriptional regulator with XRE-family HTH domain